MSAVEDLMSGIEEYKYNPLAIQRNVLKLLESTFNGELDVVDATSPFIVLLESSAILAASAMNEAASLTHKQYPSAALDMTNLYNHMSDKDFVNRFAIPAKTKFGILISKEEIEKKAVKVPSLGIRMLTIPRNTMFSVADTNFSLQYPVDIKIMSHGGFQITYDGTIKSPLQTLVTNYIDFDVLSDHTGEYLYFEVDVQQFDIISKTGSLNISTGFKMEINVDDQFYFCRVYHQNYRSEWEELPVIYTSEVYDVRKPVAVAKVNDKKITVEIPQIFTLTGALSRTIRIDVYQTKGNISLNMGNYDVGAFTAKWIALDKKEENEYVAPLKTFKSLMTFSRYSVNDGSDALDFETLRTRVLTNSTGDQHLPITQDQIKTRLANSGFDIVKNVDVVTNRIFVATRELATPINTVIKSPADACIESIQITIDEDVKKSGIMDNGDRITITPNTVFSSTKGIFTILTNEELAYINNLDNDTKCDNINNSKYFYTPFYYILDVGEDSFEIRPYDLDNPVITSKQFVTENPTTLLKVSVGNYNIEKTPNGYELTIITKSTESYKNLDDSVIQAQLAFLSPGEVDRAYLLGTLVATTQEKERIFKFNIDTNYDINNKDHLYLTNFFMYTTDQKNIPVTLEHEFDIIFTTNGTLGGQFVRSEIEDAMGIKFLPANAKGINHETIRIKFGTYLSTLWNRSRSTVTSEIYERYTTDIPAIHTEDVYDIDPVTGSIFNVDPNGNLTYNLIHSKGDPVLDTDGNPVYEHLAGDIVLDAENRPIKLHPRKIKRICDFFLIDGVFWFSDTDQIKAYKTQLTNDIVQWLNNDIINISQTLLEQTKIYFRPRTTIGDIDMLLNAGTRTKLPAQQYFRVILYVPERVFSNDILRQSLEDNTVESLIRYLKNTVQISISGLEEYLRSIYKDDVFEVEIHGFAGDDTIRIATIVNDSDRCSIKKKLVPLSNNTLEVRDDVAVSFIRHRIE